MPNLTIGILGGMGPEATVDCLAKVVKSTPAERDQDHLRVVVENNPAVPDRTPAILGTGPSPVPAMAQGCAVLELSGADFIIIPCVSAHAFIAELRAQARLPILSIFDAVADELRLRCPQAKTVGLIGTTGTIKAGHFQARLAQDGLTTLVPEEESQVQVMGCIYDIKAARPARSRAQITAALAGVAESLLKRGAQAIIAGCTEIPLALAQADLAAPYVDAVLALARAAVRRAGKEPLDTL